MMSCNVIAAASLFGNPDDMIHSTCYRLAPNVRVYLHEQEVLEDDGDKALPCGLAVPCRALLSTDRQAESRVAILPVFQGSVSVTAGFIGFLG